MHFAKKTVVPQDKRHTDERLLSLEKTATISRAFVVIAQQFNDPLQAITNVLGGIHRRGFLEQEDMALINLANQEVKKLNLLALQLREFYQPTLGKTDLFDINGQLERIIGQNTQKMLGKDITLSSAFGDNIPPIRAVTDQVNKVFQELLDTVVQACGKKGSILVATILEEDMVLVRIENSECGIPAETISQAFEPFNMALSNKTSQDLNLAISYAYITLHGGTIEATFEDGRVTIFKVSLPIDHKVSTQHPEFTVRS
jgi:signal transduction histidine kinase